jgi:hypothetical protein
MSLYIRLLYIFKKPLILYFKVYYSHMTLLSGNNVLSIYTFYFTI